MVCENLYSKNMKRIRPSCRIFTLKNVLQITTERLLTISKKEKFGLSLDTIEKIASSLNADIRACLNFLDLAIKKKSISRDQILQLLKSASVQQLETNYFVIMKTIFSGISGSKVYKTRSQ